MAEHVKNQADAGAPWVERERKHDQRRQNLEQLKKHQEKMQKEEIIKREKFFEAVEFFVGKRVREKTEYEVTEHLIKHMRVEDHGASGKKVTSSST